MAFGQQSGPPATARQIKDLTALLEALGYTGFRDARGPMGFTQRQGGGKFTMAEATAMIERLEAAVEAGGDAAEADGPAARTAPARSTKPPRAASVSSAVAAEKRTARQAAALRDVPARAMAVELERRGWIVIPPEELTAPDDPAPPA